MPLSPSVNPNMDNFYSFMVTRLPEIHFGSGSFERTTGLLARFGSRILLVTGQRSFLDTPHWPWLQQDLAERGMQLELVQVTDEPSPELVDATVARFHPAGIQVVAGIGGGSVLDAAKAIAGLLIQIPTAPHAATA